MLDQIVEKMRALKGVLLAVEKQFGKGAVMTLGEDENPEPIATIRSGSLALDLATGIGGYPRGRVVEIYGPESSGKTTLALHAIAEAQKAGGVAAFIDAEHAVDVAYARSIGVETERLLISQPDTGEQALDITEMLVRSGAIDIVVIDSVAALTPKAELEGEMGDAHMGLQARLMSQALRKLTAAAYRADTTLMFLNQLRQKIGVTFGSPETTTGGNALKFYASMRFDVRRIGQVKIGDEPVGGRTRVKIAKNKCQRLHRGCHVAHVDHALGIVRSGRIATWLVADGLLSRERVTVSWWSANGWFEGYFYGNIEFALDAESLTRMNAFWVESRAAKNTVVRILLSPRAAVGTLPRYDPSVGDGPWWRTGAGEHYVNASVQLQFLVEREVRLDETALVAFVNHHEDGCHIAPGSCRDRGILGQHGASLLLAGLVAQGVDGRPTKWRENQLRPPLAWLKTELDAERAEMKGPVRFSEATAAPLARGVLHAYWQRDYRGAAQLRALFWSDWDWRRALSEAVRRTFDIPATVNVLADWPFAMKRQEDRDRGCIPACAISVVDHEGAGLDMTEEQLVEAMQRVGGTGFERLREVLAGVADVEIDTGLRGDALAERLRNLTFTGKIHVLVAVNKPAVHCLLVEAVDATKVRYYDPGDGAQHEEPLGDFLGRTADDIAVIKPERSPAAPRY
jgi:recombination protein RecA